MHLAIYFPWSPLSRWGHFTGEWSKGAEKPSEWLGHTAAGDRARSRAKAVRLHVSFWLQACAPELWLSFSPAYPSGGHGKYRWNSGKRDATRGKHCPHNENRPIAVCCSYSCWRKCPHGVSLDAPGCAPWQHTLLIHTHARSSYIALYFLVQQCRHVCV